MTIRCHRQAYEESMLQMGPIRRLPTIQSIKKCLYSTKKAFIISTRKSCVSLRYLCNRGRRSNSERIENLAYTSPYGTVSTSCAYDANGNISTVFKNIKKLFSRDVMLAMGCGWTNMSANSLYEKYFGKNKGGWKEVSQNETLRRANNGYPTVAVWKNSTGGSGHIQVVIPAKNKNTAFAQAGRTVYFGGKLMNVNESVYKTRYYTHD